MRDLPLLARSEIVVCGAGTAGVFAAVAAAESGREVLLIESASSPGGTATEALVTPMMSGRMPGGVVNSYLTKRVGTSRAFDPLVLSTKLERMCLDAGVHIIYGVNVCGADADSGHVTGLAAADKRGLERVEGDMFIDCTGDGDVCAFAGADYRRGHPETGKNQPMSLRYMVGGVDMGRFSAFLDEMAERSGLHHTAYGAGGGRLAYAAVTSDGGCALSPVFESALKAGDLNESDLAYWQTFGVPGRPDTLAMNHPEFPELSDATDPEELTRAAIMGREAISRQMRFYRKYFPGFENAYVSQIASMVGVRESRRIATDYILTGEDVVSLRKFPDRVAQSAYPVDIHGTSLEHSAVEPDSARPWYEVPYRCLTVRGFDNLLVAGRCIGADFIAQSAFRIQYTCRALGEAAGVAAAMALERNIAAGAVNGREVAAELERRGATYL